MTQASVTIRQRSPRWMRQAADWSSPKAPTARRWGLRHDGDRWNRRERRRDQDRSGGLLRRARVQQLAREIATRREHEDGLRPWGFELARAVALVGLALVTILVVFPALIDLAAIAH